MARPSVLLLWGEDGFLLRQAALEALGGVKPREVDARDWQGGETADLATPSLFGEDRALLVTGSRALPEEALSELERYLAAPAPGSFLVLTAQVGARGKPPRRLLKLVERAGVVREVSLPRRELPRWVGARAREKGLPLEAGAVDALLEVVGESPATLEHALDQLLSAFGDEVVSRRAVLSQFSGLGEERVWDLCDRAFGKDLPGSMRSLLVLLLGPSDPLPILGAIAARLRDLVRVKALPQRMRTEEVARAAGLRYDWQGRRYLAQARQFSMEELLRIHEWVVESDRALKSGGRGDAVLASLVTAIASRPELPGRPAEGRV